MYKLTDTTTIIRLADKASIPADPANTDYANYLEWLEEGNKPKPADKPIPPTYQELRAREYPPVADYLDGIAKADDLQVQKYIDECLAVKAKYPKKAKAKKK
jgi:hypothetical protein